MKIYGEVKITGITQIVINRASAWQRVTECNGELYWVKQPGEKNPSVKIKSPCEMMKYINKLLAEISVTKITDNNPFVKRHHEIKEPTHRAWISGHTLNIVRKDLK